MPYSQSHIGKNLNPPNSICGIPRFCNTNMVSNMGFLLMSLGRSRVSTSPLELIVLVFQCRECIVLYFPQESSEGLPSFRVAAQSQRVDKHAYDVFHIGMLPSGSRRAYHDILLPRVLVQQCIVNRQ